MRRAACLSVVVLGLVAAACAQPAPPPPAPAQPDLAAEERAIREADARWLAANQAKDAAGEAAVMAADAVVFREHVDPLVGPAAYQAFEEKFFKDNPKAGGGWTTDTITVARSGDIAVQTGTYTTTGLGPKGDGKDAGKFVTFWKKVDGAWKVANDIGASTVAEPANK